MMEDMSLSKANHGKKFSPEWWKNKDVTHPWCHRFCTPFYDQDPKLVTDPHIQSTVGIVFFNHPNGKIVPVGMTAIVQEEVMEKGKPVKEDRFVFQYHPSYLADPKSPAISYNLPKQEKRFSFYDIPPFFDNLPAEGWFGKAQGSALSMSPDFIDGDGEPMEKRYHRLMMFGRDCPGAVWATYVKNDPGLMERNHEDIIAAALQSRASISGMQPKLLAIMDHSKLRPTHYWETSTHIVKLEGEPGSGRPNVTEAEYMSIKATHTLLPKDKTVNAELTKLHLPDGHTRNVLAIERFDRTKTAEGKVHFEEFNQLLDQGNHARYHGAYKQVADFIRDKAGHEQVKIFYARLLSQFVLGNVDNHLKNFAMFHNGHWELTPSYDLAPSVNYCKKGQLALFTSGESFHSSDQSKPGTFVQSDVRLEYSMLDPKKLVTMGRHFGLEMDEIKQIMRDLVARIPEAKEAIRNDPAPELHNKRGGKKTLSEDFCDRLDGRSKQLFGTMEKYFALVEERSQRKTGYG